MMNDTEDIPDFNEQLQKDLAAIDSYLASNNILASKDADGFIRYVIHRDSTGKRPTIDSCVTANYSGRLMSTGCAIIASTNCSSVRSALPRPSSSRKSASTAIASSVNSKVPLAFAIGVLVFVSSFVPLVGATLSGAVAVLVALVAQGPWTALFMLLVVIAVALACGPHLLFADEPTTALDVTIQAQILELLRQMRSQTGTSIILITHDLGVVAGMCERVNVMYAGMFVETGSASRLFAQPRHPYTLGLLLSVPGFDACLRL